jgi:hypothetical protein
MPEQEELRQLNVRVPLSTMLALQELAWRRHQLVGDLVRQILARALQEMKDA